MSLASPIAKMLSCAVEQQGVLVDGHVVELVAEPGAGDEVGAHVQRHGDQQVERDLALVVGHERLALGVDPLDHEVGLDVRSCARRASPPRWAEATGLVNAPASGVT